jgi:hypothetical protein
MRRKIASGDGPPTVRVGQRDWIEQGFSSRRCSFVVPGIGMIHGF